PTAVATDSPTVRFDFTNGPSDLPNVFRGDSILLFVWPDYTTNLVIAINAPDAGVSSLRRCGGSLRPDPQPVQTVGEMQDVMRQLRLLRDVNIHIYSPVPDGSSGFLSLCAATPLAQGTGNITSPDNDRHAIRLEGAIRRQDREPFVQRLHDEQPVKRVVVVPWQVPQQIAVT